MQESPSFPRIVTDWIYEDRNVWNENDKAERQNKSKRNKGRQMEEEEIGNGQLGWNTKCEKMKVLLKDDI